MSMLKALKAHAPQPPTNIVNADIQVVEMVQDGKITVLADTTPGAPTERPRFKPVQQGAPPAGANATPDPALKAAARDQPSDNFDLVGDDIGNPKRGTGGGRPRLHPNNAAKQQAYRDRLKRNA